MIDVASSFGSGDAVDERDLLKSSLRDSKRNFPATADTLVDNFSIFADVIPRVLLDILLESLNLKMSLGKR